MSNASVLCVGLAVLLIAHFSEIDAGFRKTRAAQFGGGYGYSQANARAQAFGGGFGPQYYSQPRFDSHRGSGRHHKRGGQHGHGHGGYGYQPVGYGYQPGGHGGGDSFSLSNSVSYSRGGVAQSSAGSSAGAIGK